MIRPKAKAQNITTLPRPHNAQRPDEEEGEGRDRCIDSQVEHYRGDIWSRQGAAHNFRG